MRWICHPAPELASCSPLAEDFKYAEEFKKLDVEALKRRPYRR